MSILSEFLHNHGPQNGWGTFFTAAFGAFAGAFAASRAHNKRALVAELNALNAAHELSVAIANNFLAFKRQIALPLKTEFERIKSAYASYQNNNKNKSLFQFTIDHRSLTALATPHAALEKMVFEKTLMRGRGLAALVTLVGTIDGLGIAIKTRNELVEEHRSKQRNDRERLEFFLGLRTAAGVMDARFPTNLEAIVEQTDFCVFYAKTLATDLARYSNDLRWKEGWLYRLRVPRIDATDWSHAERLGLMPKDADYQNWLRGFQPRPMRWLRFLASFKLKNDAE